MDNDLQNPEIDDLELQQAIKLIASRSHYSHIVHCIAESIYKNGLCLKSVKTVLDEHGVNIKDLKGEFLDFIIDYIEIIINDHIISEKEYKNATLLKRYFNIKEGEFYKIRYHKIAEILHRQFLWIYADGIVTKQEEIHKFEMQGLFGLSYDQFLEFKENDPFIKKTYQFYENPKAFTEEEMNKTFEEYCSQNVKQWTLHNFW